jgi:hypothetical protein
MLISKTWLNMSLLAGLLMAIVSLAGIFITSVYAKEHISWATQGLGQDIVNVFLIFPALLISVRYIKLGSVRGLLVWLGLLIYMAYSYVLYAFFIHFGPLFLIYIAVLGLSFYTLIGSLLELVSSKFDVRLKVVCPKWIGGFLTVNAGLFTLLWLIEILPALISGETPKSANEVGIWLNPVHVMDLAFLLPAMLMTGILVWKGKPMGNLLAVPIMVFSVCMATAIISMMVALYIREISPTLVAIPIMLVNIVLGSYLSFRFLKVN